MKKNDRIFLAGHRGLVGSSILKLLINKGYSKVITRTSKQLDLTNQAKVNNFFFKYKPKVTILAAAKVGGIYANNNYPAEFIYKNLMIQANVINAAYKYNSKKLLFLGSSCIYPRLAKQPLKEDYLLTGSLEKTNIAYSVAKISGLIMCESYNTQYIKKNIDFRMIMPTNLYGNEDNYDELNSHVIPGLIKKFHDAKFKKKKKLVLWGTGKVKREFLHSKDLASASLFIMELSKKKYTKLKSSDFSHVNVGYGKDVTIKELARKIKKIVNFKGNIEFDNKKYMDGTPRKILNSNKIFKLGWRPKISLEEGLSTTYNYFLNKND